MIPKRVALSETQKGIYFDCQVDDPTSYNISAAIRIENLQITYLEHALRLLTSEQEVLRARLEMQDGLPVLAIDDQMECLLEQHDLDGYGEVPLRLQEFIKEVIGKPFALNEGPLFRILAVKLEEARHVIVLCIHHIICDGLSLELFKTKLLHFYTCLLHHQPVALLQDKGFTTYMDNENAKLSKGKYEKQKAYWLDKLKGAEPLALKPDFPVRHRDRGVGREMRFDLPGSLLEEINQSAMEQEVTLYMFFMAAFSVLMHKYSGSEDIIFTSPFTHRPGTALEETIGCFVHMLPLRLKIAPLSTFSSLLQQVSTELIGTYKNIGYPNNLMMRDSKLLPMPGSPSIFDISLVYDAYEEPDPLETVLLDQDAVTFPGILMAILHRTPERNQIRLQYKTNVFADSSIALMGQRFLRLLAGVARQLDLPIEQINLLLEDEEKQILQDFNRTSHFPYHPRHIAEVLHEKVRRYPDRLALIEGERQETYAQVNAKANQLARHILRGKTRKEEAVGVQLYRSADLVISLLAILKAGCAFVPIDPQYPAARMDYIIADAGISTIITSRQCPVPENGEVSMLFVDGGVLYEGDDRNLDEPLDPHSLAYIMYTSGSTGKPKGVMIENHSVVNTLLDLDRRFPMKADDRYLLKTAFTFDVSATELFGWFMGEGSLCILEPGGEKNPQLIAEQVYVNKITHINFVPTLFRLFLEMLEIRGDVAQLNSLKWVCVGGEAVTPDLIQKFNSLDLKASLENVYGPTECTIWVSHHSLRGYESPAPVPIGYPLNESRWYVVGSRSALQPVGIQGELCLSGVGLARGYLNMAQLTGEKFVPNPFFKEGVDPKHFRFMYRTGDLVRWLPSGTIEYLGRIDFQVKVRGVRLETGEIENVLAEFPGVVQAAAVVKQPSGKPAVLCVYYLSEREIASAELKEHLSKSLPAYMIPSYFVHMQQFPHNSSGKIDRNALIADTEYMRQQPSVRYAEPVTVSEKLVAAVWSEVLAVPAVGLEDDFFELGGNSVSVIQAHNKLNLHSERELPITAFFQYPKLREFAAQLAGKQPETVVDRKTLFRRSSTIHRQEIAIIGASIHVPGADTVHDFWRNMVEQRESIYFYSDEELREIGIAESLLRSPDYVKAKGRVKGVDQFDPGFFEYTPSEVRMMSPQFRLMYRGVWEALEDAGCVPEADVGKIGVFLGGSDDFEWYRSALLGEGDYSNKYQAFTLSTNHFLATRIAYKLNLKGPVFTALTGCSTSLVTPHLACQSLLVGECDIAIAGGITVELPNEGGYLYEEGMMFSADGHCRPFDADASGTVFSNGMGIVVLKRLEDALQDRDHIYGVIKGSAINNDGSQKVSFLAPSVEGQAEVIREAYRVARVDPESVTYIEAHGTGTLLGDPIEVESLTQAFASDRKQFCHLGSVKGNVGHMDTAAGVVGLIKVALSLKHRYLPGTVNYRRPNPKIDFANTPFKVNDHGVPWKPVDGGTAALRAGINSFGVGGTNAHMILEEAPRMEASSPDDDVNLLIFSAKSETSLHETADRVIDYLLHHHEQSVSDAAWTLKTGRREFIYRKALVIDDSWRDDPERVLKRLKDAPVRKAQAVRRPVYFMFPGQGSQYQGMGRDLYLSSRTTGLAGLFRQYVNQVLDLLPEGERKEMLATVYGHQEPLAINQTEYSQFALFMTSYAMAKSLIDIGIRPDGMIGHSIGELAAAAVAGVFDLSDAVAIVRMRGRLMQRQPGGVMLAVMADAEEVNRELELESEPEAWLALVNTTGSCVAGGTFSAIGRLEERAEKLGWRTIRVKTSHAFHTPMMADAAEQFGHFLAAYALREPQIPLQSNISGTWAQPREMTAASYWAKHILQPVQFASNLAEVLKQEHAVFIEVGAGRTLGAMARQHAAHQAPHEMINMLRHPQETEHDEVYVEKKLGELWCAGLRPNWQALKGEAVRLKASLPTYAFDMQYFPVHTQIAPSFGCAPASAIDLQQRETEPANFPSTRDELETAVLTAYKTVLGIETIQPDDNFFALGGDSLKAVSLSSAIRHLIGRKADISEVFTYPSPAELASYLNSQEPSGVRSSGILQAAPRKAYPLSSAQQRMFALAMLAPESIAYNLPSVTIIHGPLDRERVEWALEQLIRRHESLRTTFEIRDRQAVQIIQSSVKVSIDYTERRIDSSEEIDDLIRERVRPFDLSRAPLLRVELVKSGEDTHLLLFDIHHIIADGTSVEIITRDFNALYFGHSLPVCLQYKDYAVWQQEKLASGELAGQRDYWLNRLSSPLPVLELPTDFPRPAHKGRLGRRIYFAMDSALTSKLTEMAGASESTMYMVMLSIWTILLARYSGQEDIVVGTPVAGRTQEEWKEISGMFVNMLAMRSEPKADKTYTEYLSELKRHTLEAFGHQDYPFDELVRDLHVSRDFSRNPLFDVCFDYQNMELHDLELNGLQFSSHRTDPGTATYDLVLTCQENKQERVIEGFVEYATDLFCEETARRMIRHLLEISRCVAGNPRMTIAEIDLLPADEKHAILRQGSGPELDYDRSLRIQGMFQRQVETKPDATALIVAGGRAWTYRELNEKANVLAWQLIDQGVRRNELIGVMSRRDEGLLIAMLAVMKAGAAYVPIDPGFPDERILQMIGDCRMKMLICSASTRDRIDFGGLRLVYDPQQRDERAEANPELEAATAADLACVIFTSGSTGRPKGVMIRQDSLVNFVEDVRERRIFRRDSDRVISVTTPSFDIFAFESITPLCTGHSLYLADECEQLDPALAGKRIVEYGVTHILSTVSRIKAFAENPEFAQGLRQLTGILSGGENFPLPLLHDLQQRSAASIYNMYGPTETTIWSTVKELTTARHITVGRPIANTRSCILNEAGKLQPVGVYGELHIGGRGLAAGYLNNEAETARRFVTCPDVPGERLYRTGDRARMLPGGELELLGRLDTQVKLRGYRIELSELEQLALSHDGIREAVAKVMGDRPRSQQLVLFYCLKAGQKAGQEHPSALKAWLQERVPHYMVPAHVVMVSDMPVLPNGKIDRNALMLTSPLPVQEEADVRISAGTELERILIEAWKDVLNLENVSVHDHFFDLGGNSLGLILINNRLNAYLGRSVPLVKLFEHSTISSLVKSLHEEDAVKRSTFAEPALRVSPHQKTSPAGPTLVPAKQDVAPISAEGTASLGAPLHSQSRAADIAVIGMAGRFPQAANIEEFWQNLLDGVDAIERLDDADLLASGVSVSDLTNPHYVKAKGVLEDTEYFDAPFFNYTYQESNTMDPQIRLLHQCAWKALENAGCDPYTYEGQIGLFAGSGLSLPWMTRFLGHSGNMVNAFEAMTLNEKDYVATRVAHKLNLRGPSFTVQTACSTSLVAIHQAVQALSGGECDMALAGGVSISYPLREGYVWHEGMIYSKDGHCRPFSSQSSGTVSGNGCGIVVLKPLEAALRDGDCIYSIIKGSAVNNDGTAKPGYTAPSVAGQAQVIKSALHKAGVAPEEIVYLEAHGTGTKLGDPIEIEALKHAWNTDKTNYCAIGSVKANVGHLDAAAGVAGLIKTVLTLYHRVLPPQIHYDKPNPMIDFRQSPFYVNTEARRIAEQDRILRAGVSSFGIGGTNAHVILEEPPVSPRGGLQEAISLLPFSAKSKTALDRTTGAVVSYLKRSPNLQLSDAAWTLQTGRAAFYYRKALVVVNRIMPDGEPDYVVGPDEGVPDSRRPLVLVLSGANHNYPGMAKQLYASMHQSRVSRLFRAHFDEVLACLDPAEQYAVRQAIAYGSAKEGMTPLFLMFAIHYALSNTLMKSGLLPDAVLGEGIGELSGWTVTGEVSLEDAVGALYAAGPAAWPTKPGVQTAALTKGDRTEEEEYRELLDVLVGLPRRTPLFPQWSSCSWENAGGEPPIFICSYKHTETEANLERSAAPPSWNAVSLLRPERETYEDDVYLLRMVGQLWCLGAEVDWTALNGEEHRRKIALPTYAFDRIVHEHDVSLHHMLGAPQSAVGQKSRAEALRDHTVLDPGDVVRKLSVLWMELLGCDGANEEDNFFGLGGHSLKAIALAARIQQEMGVEMPLDEIFNRPVFADMADWLIKHCISSRSGDCGISALGQQPYYEVSSAQKRMYVVHEMTGEALPYNLASFYIITGELDTDRFTKAIDALVQRHEAFRTRFGIVNGEIVQWVEEQVPSAVELLESTEDRIVEEMRHYVQPFDLYRAPLIRVKLTRLGEMRYALFIDMHHMISDQTSIAILLREFAALYAGEELPALTIQYKDFAAWQNRQFQSEQFAPHKRFWQEQFAGEIPMLSLLTDFNRPRNLSFNGGQVTLALDESLCERVNAVSAERAITPSMLFMATLKLLLWKYTGQTDMVVGTAVAGRRHPELDGIVGMFVNMLAIRSQVAKEWTLDEYFQAIKKKLIACYEHQDFPYELLVELLDLPKDPSRNPLFDIAMNYVNMGTEELAIGDLTLEPWNPDVNDTKFDMTWTVLEKDRRYSLNIEYNAALFKHESIEQYSEKWQYLLSQLVSGGVQTLRELTLTTPREREWLLYELNATERAYPRDSTLAELFAAQAQQHGGRTALIWDEREMTYAELNNRANHLAGRLVDQGVSLGSRLAILLDRGPLQIISILAILKAGCAYVPIDPKYPEERVAFILRDSGACLILTEKAHAQSIAGWDNLPSVLELDSPDAVYEAERIYPDRASSPTATDTAYLIYTSGSTGRPKGTLISHRNVVKVMRASNFITVQPDDHLLQLSNYAFDGSIFDIFGALLNGAGLVLINKDMLIDMEQLTNCIRERGITVFFITTALFNMLVDWDVTCLANVRKVMFGGEAASLVHVCRALQYIGPGRLLHVYGPTETTFIATYFPLDIGTGDLHVAPIGYPLSNTTLYVLDADGEPVPPLVAGELYIGGAGVGQGYLNLKELTSERFIPNPFVEGDRLYRTGDLVRRLPDGAVVFLERHDFQVKIRGFRVELSEIENRLRQLDGIREAVTISAKDSTGSLYIAAYYTTYGGKTPGPAEIRQQLQRSLPEYMIPERLISVASLPLTPNGKVDRKALSAPSEQGEAAVGPNGPSTEMERLILDSMQQVLGHKRIGVTDDFFRHGGQSIKGIALVKLLSERGIRLKINELFRYPTAEKLASVLAVNKHESAKTESYPPAQRRADAVWPISPISLGEHQVDRLVSHAQYGCTMISDFMASAGQLARFPLAPVQRAHAAMGSRFSGFIAAVNGELEEDEVKRRVVEAVGRHQLLHSFAWEDDELFWQEYDCFSVAGLLTQYIPYIDLRQYTEDTKHMIEEKLRRAMLFAPCRRGELPWRVGILRTRFDQHQVIWGFDHMVFDGMSAEVIQRQLEEPPAVRNTDSGEAPASAGTPLQYRDYVALLSAGPADVDEEEIVGRYDLRRWEADNRRMLTRLEAIAGCEPCELQIQMPLSETDLEKQWWAVLDQFVRAIAGYAELQELPIALVNYGRSYRDARFYHCVGEFLDLIPLVAGPDIRQADVTDRLDYARRYAVNFMALVHDRSLSERYGKIRELLGSAFKLDGSPNELILFNFQGFIPKEHRIEVPEADELRSRSALARIELVMHYDEDSFYVEVSSAAGLNIERMRQSIAEHVDRRAKLRIQYQAMEVENV
ncbi:non-ribosomal peptide synthetase/type I polyketide synthase [Paenibacillus caui]|uniref:non-ribosomal peptide synthetase/type I polyketide synthase n=1 Tax=Paenibacillus caui TaxID=2873927 RepID=UPI001CAA11A3|nr:non-ribosomal peptide synthetase/type I polyketide synthase [Paenibacillus caui]